MSSAAQITTRSRTPDLSPRISCAAAAAEPARRCHRLSRAFIALPVVAIILKGFADGLGALQHALAQARARSPRSELTLDHGGHGHGRHQRRDGHAARLHPGPLRVPGARRAVRRSSDLPHRDPHARHGSDAGGASTAPTPRSAASSKAHRDPRHLRAARHPARAARRDAAVRPADRAAGAAGARPRRGGGRAHPGRQRLDHVPPGRAPGAPARDRGRRAALSFARACGEFGSIVIVSGNIPNKTLTAPVYIFQLAVAVQARGGGGGRGPACSPSRSCWC